MDSMKEVYDGIKKLITITEKIEGHTKDVEEIKDKVGAIEGRLNSLDTGQKEVKVDTRKNAEDIAEIKGKVEVIEERLNSLDTGQKVISVDIRAIKDKLEVKDEIYAIKERLSAVETEMGKIKA